MSPREIPGMYHERGVHWSHHLREVLPQPPAGPEPFTCQWAELTTSGPAAEWPQDRYHRGVLRIGADCAFPAEYWATYACPSPDSHTHAGECDEAPHRYFLICWNHRTYAVPCSPEFRDLHTIGSGLLKQATPEWSDWSDRPDVITAKKAHDAAALAGPGVVEAAPVVAEPAMF